MTGRTATHSAVQSADGWTLAYDAFVPEQQGLREALCALGNGYCVSRGAFPWAHADEVHYPGTYLAGGYNRLTTEIAGRGIVNEDLVNLPDWTTIGFRPDGGDWFTLAACEVLSFRQELDLRGGVLTLCVGVRDRDGRETEVAARRFVHMEYPHLMAQELSVRPKNWSGGVEIRSTLDGRVINAGVKRYASLASTHLDLIDAAACTGEVCGDEMMTLVTAFTQSRQRIGQAARTRLVRGGQRLKIPGRIAAAEGCVTHSFHLEVGPDAPVTVEKVAALHTGRDVAISEPGLAAREAVDCAPVLGDLEATHRRAWERLWRRSDITVNGDARTQMILRLHVFHLLQTLSPNTVDLDVGVPARGWHGEAYRGHVFWDELFILPFLKFRLPAIAKAMIRYRHHRLGKARAAAQAAGLRGAMFPWQSGSDGREESQVVHLNPRSGRWVPDFTWQQRHVSLAVAYNAWTHYTATGDRAFLESRGAELILEIARFFASITHYNPTRERYEIHRVMGPDEYHDAYPDAEEPGLNNNAYTNVFTAWLMATTETLLAEIDPESRAELCAKLQITPEETAQWADMGRRMFVPFHDDGILSQFEGYERLKEFDWEGYRARYGDIHRLDRILEAEGDSANRYKLSKQADVLMLFYLFPERVLEGLLARLGYDFGPEQWQRTIDYYLARTSHGSTLSYLVHTWVMARSRPEQAWELFRTALESDVSDIQGGTTAEGIHLGAMAGTVDLVQRCFTGLDVHDGALCLDPVMPHHLRDVSLRVRFREKWLQVAVVGDTLTLSAAPDWTEPLRVRVAGEAASLNAGESRAFTLRQPPASPSGA
ncbi:glycoside hydrolase family 65 protein [Caenispirillum bisanense]|uniref:Trehalose and maltose hydrolase (Possible phosphorylase) n=1 Tax=Caenispirillum bisanense TaxID=414052 RepID=A0A286GWJ3_9PROT|nr:glycosyl hydrolase family 65 protein [Caenispirillum bisanense]SOD99871.1 Trehalose and maltose hydrolase (possible phosphorylase) [Caenispirillum bisanense]